MGERGIDIDSESERERASRQDEGRRAERRRQHQGFVRDGAVSSTPGQLDIPSVFRGRYRNIYISVPSSTQRQIEAFQYLDGQLA